MCGGLKYKQKAEAQAESIRTTYFPIPHALIPVIDEHGEITLQQWGRRKGEDENYPVPATGWARLASIEDGKWNGERVRIPALCFMEKDEQRKSHWFDLEPDNYLLGLRVNSSNKNFIYIVTIESPFEYIHDRWPIVVNPKLEQVNPKQTGPEQGPSQLKLF